MNLEFYKQPDELPSTTSQSGLCNSLAVLLALCAKQSDYFCLVSESCFVVMSVLRKVLWQS